MALGDSREDGLQPSSSEHSEQSRRLRVLLELFSGSSDRPAEQEYAIVRQRLVTFFEYRGAVDAISLADEALDRVADKMLAGHVVHDAPAKYALGFARHIYREYVKRRVRQERAVQQVAEAPAPPVEEAAERVAHEARLEALERCLEHLVPAERQRVMHYYQGRGRQRISARAALAETLGLTNGALRLQMHRTRKRLQDCVEGQLHGQEAS